MGLPEDLSLDLRIPLHKLDVFRHVVEIGSVTRAAERLHVSQPVVTAHIRSLEERFGAALLRRDRDGMRPTEAGELVYRWAVETLSRGQELAREIQDCEDGNAGQAVIAATLTAGSYMLPDVLVRFCARRPNARVVVTISEIDQAIRSVGEGSADLGIMLEEDERLVGHLMFEPVAEIEILLIAAPDSPVEEVIRLAELRELRFIGMPHVTYPTLRRKMSQRRDFRLGPTALELGSPEAMKRAVCAGLGVAFLTRPSVQDELDRGVLRTVHIYDLSPLSTTVCLAYRDDKRFTPMQAALCAHIRETLNASGPDGRLNQPAIRADFGGADENPAAA
jgi:DNA-binding transcriptional LysR family regulator